MTVPDGTVEERTTDSNGLIELKTQEPGGCYKIVYAPDKAALNNKEYLFYNRCAPFEKGRQDDPNGAVVLSSKSGLTTGAEHVISIWQPTVIVDSHMHIQSGRCAPLQYLQSLMGFSSKTSRLFIENSGIVGGLTMQVVFEPFLSPLRALARVFEEGGGRNPEDGFITTYPIRKLSKQSQKSTKKNALDFMKERKTVLDEFFLKNDLYLGASNLILASVVMTMDMEYSHLDGYFGIPIYNPLYKFKEKADEEKPDGYWTTQHGRWVTKKGEEGCWDEDVFVKNDRGKGAYVVIGNENRHEFPETIKGYERYAKTAETAGIIGTTFDKKSRSAKAVRIDAVPVLLPDKETELYENWKKQLRETEMAVLANPLALLPMFHYDPRRWQLHGNDEPMSKVVQDTEEATGQAIYLGFKMYTAQGYRPWDPWLPILEEFYAECCLNDIPIMNHCTPGGAATCDREEYRDFVHPNESDSDKKQKEGRTPLQYFNEQFVAPWAWKEVLDKTVVLGDEKSGVSKYVSLHSLRLCLAHFGGPTSLGMEWNQQIIAMLTSRKYPNLYTDISSSFADSGFRKDFKKIIIANPSIKNRILFGTDWFMTFFYDTTVGKNFWDYCVETKSFLDSFDTSLWPAFTQYNPYNFYRLGKQIRRISKNIIAKRLQPQAELNLGKMQIKDINLIKKYTNYIENASQFNEDIEETPWKD